MSVPVSKSLFLELPNRQQKKYSDKSIVFFPNQMHPGSAKVLSPKTIQVMSLPAQKPLDDQLSLNEPDDYELKVCFTPPLSDRTVEDSPHSSYSQQYPESPNGTLSAVTPISLSPEDRKICIQIISRGNSPRVIYDLMKKAEEKAGEKKGVFKLAMVERCFERLLSDLRTEKKIFNAKNKQFSKGKNMSLICRSMEKTATSFVFAIMNYYKNKNSLKEDRSNQYSQLQNTKFTSVESKIEKFAILIMSKNQDNLKNHFCFEKKKKDIASLVDEVALLVKSVPSLTSREQVLLSICLIRKVLFESYRIKKFSEDYEAEVYFNLAKHLIEVFKETETSNALGPRSRIATLSTCCIIQ